MSGSNLKIKKKFDGGHNTRLIVPPLHLASKIVFCDPISIVQHFNQHIYIW